MTEKQVLKSLFKHDFVKGWVNDLPTEIQELENKYGMIKNLENNYFMDVIVGLSEIEPKGALTQADRDEAIQEIAKDVEKSCDHTIDKIYD